VIARYGGKATTFKKLLKTIAEYWGIRLGFSQILPPIAAPREATDRSVSKRRSN
jgi:hypothetical protein